MLGALRTMTTSSTTSSDEPTPARKNRRRAPRPKNRALCCECGQLRTVGEHFEGKRPAGREEPDQATWTNWLKCTECGRITLHAEIQDANRARGFLTRGCIMEEENRQEDVGARIIRRRIAGLRADGIEIEWVDDPILNASDQECALGVELRTNGPVEYLRIELWSAASKRQLRKLLETIEHRIDDLDDPLRARLRQAPEGLALGPTRASGRHV